jgi:hypothetical protein
MTPMTIGIYAPWPKKKPKKTKKITTKTRLRPKLNSPILHHDLNQSRIENQQSLSYGYESLPGAPPIGSVEHIQASAETLRNMNIAGVAQLQDFLTDYWVPDSIGHFISLNQTHKKGRPDIPIKLDTRDRFGYSAGPVLDAEYNFDPVQGNSYIFVFGRPYPAQDYSFLMRMYLDQSHNIDRRMPLEAHIYHGERDASDRYTYLYRSQAKPEYGEDSAWVFANVLGQVAESFDRFIKVRREL